MVNQSSVTQDWFPVIYQQMK